MGFQGIEWDWRPFPQEKSAHPRVHITKRPSGVNLQTMELQTPELRGLDLFAASREPMRVSRLWIYITQLLVRMMGSGKSVSSVLNLRDSCQ